MAALQTKAARITLELVKSNIMNLLNNIQFVNHPLNQAHKIEAIIRFLRWQIGSRIVQGDIIYQWVSGAKFIVRPGETGLTGNIYSGLHEFSDMAYLLHTLNSDDLFIDIGANVGSYTILACAVKKAKGYCFEPVPTTFERLMANIRINDIGDRVIALNIGLSDQEDKLLFTVDENCMNHVATDNEHSKNNVEVKVSRLDTILKDCDPHLMKIDVEGFETIVLNGATETLNKQSLNSVIMELNGSGSRYGFNEEDILRLMSNCEFHPYTYDPFSREIETLEGKNNLSGNTIFIRNINLALERIKASPLVSILNTKI